MNTVAVNNPEKTKKLIELPSDVCRRLAVQAAAMGTSVKRLIESIVINSIADSDDDAVFAYLSETRPEGNVMLSDDEQTAFLKRMRAKADNDEV
ncbi:MAG: hypothetical protein K2I24_05835 [Duncaniella sp.]|nr:hypothetical protein [Duncaniella sp.]